ncbi:MAG: filamentous hemagglutinin N-terminal domain-containing protein [Gloeocapsa sp. DLM2.Bin57]|nr:MAG: filamentous hemagglutinin N-terminal domain-containing protein [Gloeocapsa sp. DLM2.Bin57]
MKKIYLLQLLLLTLIGSQQQVAAQIIPDQTLERENSAITQQEAKDIITGGARRGGNLFHSFQEFNVQEFQQVYFANPRGIENILTRVTGRNVTNILGVLGVQGSANLFLINPNGIYFGPNARLDVRGAFTATTADGILLGEEGIFSASNPETSVLLRVNPSGVFSNALREHNRNIQVEGVLTLTGESNLTLIGDNLNLTGATIEVARGNLTLTGREINLTATSNILSQQGGDIAITSDNLRVTEGSRIESDGRGEIRLEVTENLTITGFNTDGLFSGILSTGGGNILVNPNQPQGEVEISARGFIASLTDSNQPGGAIALNVNNLNITEGGQILSISQSNAPGGDIIINATENITIEGKSFEHPFGGVNIYHLDNLTFKTDVNPDVEESGANGIPYLSIQRTDTDIRTEDTVITSLENTYGNLDYYSFTIETAGSEGIFDIDYGSYGEVNKANMDSIIFVLNAVTGELIDKNDDSEITQGAGGSVSNLDSYLRVNFEQPGTYILGVGHFNSYVAEDKPNQAPVFIDRRIAPGQEYTLQLSLENRGKTEPLDLPFNPNYTPKSGIYSLNYQQGAGGNITLKAREFNLGSDAEILSHSFGRGKGGDLAIEANLIEVVNAKIEISPYGEGDGGNIRIETLRLRQDNGKIWTDTYSWGETRRPKGGDILVIATESVEILAGSRITTDALHNNQAGNIRIETQNMRVSGSRISPNAFQQSLGGDLTIIASESLELSDRSFIEVESFFSTGDAGDLLIQTDRLLINQRSVIDTSTERPEGGGDGGDTRIIAREIMITEGSKVSTETFGDGNAGNMLIETETLTISDGAVLSTATTGVGTGGKLTIIATDSVNLNNFSLVETRSNAQGMAGNLTIATGSLILRDRSNLSTATRGTNLGGEININALQKVEIDNASLNSAAEIASQGNSGNIEINTTELLLNNGGRIQAQTQGTGIAGDVNINANEVKIFGVNQAGYASGIISASESTNSGRGGEINLHTHTLRITERGFLNARTLSNNDGGSIYITTDRLILDTGGQIITSAKTESTGNAGIITVEANTSIEISGTGTDIEPPEDATIGTPFAREIVYDLRNFELTNEPNPDVEPGLPYITVERTITDIKTGETILGEAGNQFDYYLFGVAEGDTQGIFDIDYGNVNNIPFSTDTDTMLFLFDINGRLLGSNDNADISLGGSGSVREDDAYLTTTFAQPGLYVIGVAENGSIASDTLLIRGNVMDAGDTYQLHISLESPGNFITDIQFEDLNPNLGLLSGLFAQTLGTGDGGNISLNTPNLSVNGAIIDASSLNIGTGGNIIINADNLSLNQGNISATSSSGRGGNLNLTIANTLSLEQNSTISTQAGTENTAGGDGGNINISNQFLFVFDNSTINANAFAGNGGNITINAEAIFLNSSDSITASSQLGVDGIIEIKSLDLKRNLALIANLQPQNPAEQITPGCGENTGNNFVVTGKGGLPTKPDQVLTSQQIWRDRRDLSESVVIIPTTTETPAIIQANHWRQQSDGTIILTHNPSCPPSN